MRGTPAWSVSHSSTAFHGLSRISKVIFFSTSRGVSPLRNDCVGFDGIRNEEPGFSGSSARTPIAQAAATTRAVKNQDRVPVPFCEVFMFIPCRWPEETDVMLDANAVT